jgi:hypothetical protein
MNLFNRYFVCPTCGSECVPTGDMWPLFASDMPSEGSYTPGAAPGYRCKGCGRVFPFHRAYTESLAFQKHEALRSPALAVRASRWALPERLAVLVELKARLLEVSDDALGELVSGIVRQVLSEDPPQQIAASRDRKADRKDELVPEAAVVHGGDVLDLFLWRV